MPKYIITIKNFLLLLALVSSYNECRDWIGGTPALYSRSAGFKSRLTETIPRFVVVFFSHSRQIPGKDLKLSYNYFLHIFSKGLFINLSTSPGYTDTTDK
jgi:hypothetical protein